MADGTFGTQLKEMYRQGGYTQESFAEAIGVSVKTVSRWGRNISRPSAADFERICVTLTPVLNREIVRMWAQQIGHRLPPGKLDELFSTEEQRIPREALPLPEDLAERSAVLRTLYHGKRCLVVLDGLWAAEGLAHLRVIDEPGRLLATSRDRLPGGQLGGATLPLAVPRVDFGKRILQALLPGMHVPESVLSKLVARLGGLPLAVGLLQSGLPVDIATKTLAICNQMRYTFDITRRRNRCLFCMFAMSPMICTAG